MNPPKIEKTISIGNILTIVAMIITLIVGYEATVVNVAANAKNTSENAKGVLVNAARIDKLSDRMTSLIDAIQSDRINQTQLLTEMKVDLRYLRQTVDEIRKGQ